MNVRRGMIKMSLALAVVAATAWYVAGESCAAQHHHPAPSRLPPATERQPAPKPQPMKPGVPALMDARRLAATQEAIARAIAHVEAGRQRDALRELRQVQTSLEFVRQAMVKNALVNDRCPIMGAPIDPGKVSAALTRAHEGHSVAFCCAGCPRTWDQLTYPEKTAKLANVTARPQ